MAITQVSDVIVPGPYTRYLTRLTEKKSRLVGSGAVVRDSKLDALMDGGGLIFTVPAWNDLADDAENVSIGTTGSPATPKNITTTSEKAVRLSRNQGWGSVDLAETLAGEDPMTAIADRVEPYWTRRFQDAVIATIKGVIADNEANDGGDMVHDVTGTFDPDVTAFSAENFIDATATWGDSDPEAGVVIMHSVVYNQAKQNNLIDFIPDSANPQAASIPTFLGRRVVVDDGTPVTGNDYETLIMGFGAIRWGVGTPPVPAESIRVPQDANGGGSEQLWSRVEWVIHPAGFAYVGTPPDGGPTNAATSNNLAAATSWDRRIERKAVKIAVLRTTEA